MKLLVPKAIPTQPPKHNHRQTSFLGRLRPWVHAQAAIRERQIFASKRKQQARRELVLRQLAHFRGNAKTMLSAMSLVCRPSTVKTAAITLATVRPDLASTTAAVKQWASLAMQRPAGRPRQARRVSPTEFSSVLRLASPRVRSAMILMWVTASRAIDLQHFDPEAIGDIWRITLIPRVDDGALIGPKSDPRGRLRLIKWVRAHPAIDPFAKASWEEIDSIMKQLNSTPHAIRGSAIKYLENRGYSTSEIRLLTAHAPAREAVGCQSYLNFSPNDPGARTAMRMAEELLRSLSL